MAKKKNFKTKTSQENQAVASRPRKKILGMDIKDLGAAIAAAVISEIAQVAVQKASENSGSDQHAAKKVDDAFTSAQASAQTMVAAVKDSLTEKPLQHGASVLAGALNQINPSLSKLAHAAQDAIQANDVIQATEQSIGDTAKNTVSNMTDTTDQAIEHTNQDVEQLIHTANAMNDLLKDTIQEATNKVATLFEENKPKHKKSKKNKNKKKGKKNKK